jgi:Ricin-type beta-trefoil lectin domain.
MRRIAGTVILGAATLGLSGGGFPHASGVLVSKKGTKCLTAMGSRVVASACTASAEQIVSANFAVGGLQIGERCLRHDKLDLTLAPCDPADSRQVFAFDESRLEISPPSVDSHRLCIQLGGTPGEWRADQEVILTACRGAASQTWMLAELKMAPGRGTARESDKAIELKSGDYIIIDGRFLVVR